jgi:gluconate 2-dehydrogenase gamma chain
MLFLDDRQARCLIALCERILPPGPDGPGASEVHVVEYIDGQLAGPWGRGKRFYRQPPFSDAEDGGHGWQLPLTPAEAYAEGLAAIDRYACERYGAEVADLPGAQQDEVVAAWEAGEVATLGRLNGVGFFAMVRQNVAEGLFSDPSYGGNHELAGWRWLGYPGKPLGWQ